jgi:hypothetical protein
MPQSKEQISEIAKTIEETLAFKGAVTYNPVDHRVYAGRAVELVESGFRGAQLVTPVDIASVKSQVVLEEVLGMARLAYNLRNMVRVFPSNKLEFHIDKATRLTASRVAPLEEPDISAFAWERISFSMVKDVTLVVVSDEARMTAAHDILGSQIEDAAASLAKAENDAIASVAESATTIAGSDWGGAANPYEDIIKAAEAIASATQVEPSVVAAHPYVWADFWANDAVKGQLVGVQMPPLQAKSFALPGLPGWTGISDWALTNTKAIVASVDKRYPGIVEAEGPTESARFRNELAGYDAFIIRRWYHVKLPAATTADNAIRVLTGVHA